ncbi:MAG: hypothetical protein MHM6MM_003287 [Cercozoa sp. M6MM]
MGLTLSRQQKAERQRQREMNRNLRKDRDEELRRKKLLLLGAGESGKSTLFKQMVSLYGKGFSDAERRNLTKTVYMNTTAALRALVEKSDELADMSADLASCRISEENTEAKRWVLEEMVADSIDASSAAIMIKLWRDPGVQYTYTQRHRFQLIDSAGYFMESLERISQPDFVPTFEDVLRVRVRTTGIVDSSFEIQGRTYNIFDVGGQRNERKKWIHCFEGVNAIIFVAALSAYNQLLFEDDTTNRMQESLRLFDEVCNSHWFEKTSIILFLNKRDLFEAKLQASNEEFEPISKYFPDFQGDPRNFDEVVDFVQTMFEVPPVLLCAMYHVFL